MKAIDLDGLLTELQKFGTDERIIRPLMVLAQRVNSTLHAMESDIEDIADDRITMYHDHINYMKRYDDRDY